MLIILKGSARKKKRGPFTAYPSHSPSLKGEWRLEKKNQHIQFSCTIYSPVHSVHCVLQNISTVIEFTSNRIDGLDVSIVADCTGATDGTVPNSCSNVAVGVPVSVLGRVHWEYSSTILLQY